GPGRAFFPFATVHSTGAGRDGSVGTPFRSEGVMTVRDSSYNLRLETLEDRLPPGDVGLTAWARSLSLLGPEALTSAFDADTAETVATAAARPALSEAARPAPAAAPAVVPGAPGTPLARPGATVPAPTATPDTDDLTATVGVLGNPF